MEKEHGRGKHHKYGMVIDLDKCTGCGTCMTACAAENNVSVRSDESDKERSITWMHLYKITNGKEFPETEVSYFPRPCMHCDEDGRGGHHPSCVSVCVANATRLDHNTGIVSQIYTRCIGCRYCQAACPYHARYFNWWDAYFPKGKGLDRAGLGAGRDILIFLDFPPAFRVCLGFGPHEPVMAERTFFNHTPHAGGYLGSQVTVQAFAFWKVCVPPVEIPCMVRAGGLAIPASYAAGIDLADDSGVVVQFCGIGNTH